MDYETEMNDLKERVATLEKRLNDLRKEVKTLYAQMERESGASSIRGFSEKMPEVSYLRTIRADRELLLYSRRL